MMTLQQGKHFIFVGGAPRSGTTLLQNMLDSHPEILGGPEFLHLPDVISLRSALYGSIDRNWIDQFCSREDVDGAVRFLIDKLMLPIASDHPGRFLSEKTPENILVFSELLDLFPDAHFIFLVRDPRSIVASMVKVGQRAKEKGVDTAGYTQNVRRAAEYTAKCLSAGFAAVDKAGDRILTVVFENLVVNPERESQRICEYLGIDWTEQMLYPSRFEHPGRRAITIHSDQIWYDADTYDRDPDPSPIKKWQQDLARWEQLYVTRTFENNTGLRDLDYDFTLHDIGRLDSCRYYGRLAAQQFRQWLGKAYRRF